LIKSSNHRYHNKWDGKVLSISIQFQDFW